MPKTSRLTTLLNAVQNDYAAFCTAKGCDKSADIFIEPFDREALIKISYGDAAGDAQAAKSYAAKLKKQFGYISDGEGEECAVDLVIPAARAADMAAALNNPSKAGLAKDFNTVVFTGTLTVSRAAATEAAEKAGFRVAGAVTKDTNYVVAGDNAGSKEEKARDLGIKVLSEAQWNRLLKKAAPK